MRYREQVNSLAYSNYLQSTEYVQHPNLDFTTDIEYLSSQTYIAMLDVVTPNWRERIAQGEIINNPMLKIAFSQTFKPIIFSFTQHDSMYNEDVNYVRGYNLPQIAQATSLDWTAWLSVLSEYDSDRDLAVSKAWANVDISEIQALASLGELPETMHWMASLMKRMISIMRAFSQKRLLLRGSKFLRSGKSIIDAMSEMWLEFRYAVRPLIFDMKQAMEAWNNVLDKSLRFTARGYTRSGPSVSSETSPFDTTWWSGIISRVQTLSTDFRAGVLFTLDSNIKELRSVWGLDQPFETIWELIPFSFIVDWFFSVGTVISSWTINPGLNPLASYVTEEIKLSSKHTLSGLGCNIPVSGTITTSSASVSQIGSVTLEQVTKRRMITPHRPIMPSFNLNLDTAKLIDLAAIGRDVFRLLNRRS